MDTSKIITFPKLKAKQTSKKIYTEFDRQEYTKQLTFVLSGVISEFIRLHRKQMTKFEFTAEDVALIIGVAIGSKFNEFIASSILQKNSCSDEEHALIKAVCEDSLRVVHSSYQKVTETFLNELKKK